MRPLSQKTKYALRALQVLSASYGDGPVLISDLAGQEELPRKFLELILLQLKNNGILESKRGKGGGYRLRRDPKTVTLGQVIRIFEGPLAPIPCVSETAFRKCDECEDVATCGTRLVMREVRDATARILDHTSLADLARKVEEVAAERARDPMYHI
jgi:Rrf2 family protein